MNEKDEWIIQKYKEEEKMMILLFAQWCVDHGENAVEVYQTAYPYQEVSPLLKEMLKDTVPAKESEGIQEELLLDVLSAFGNEELAFTVAEISSSHEEKRL
ncbi:MULTISPECIES: hypothetical protein [Salimicrobium]|uniref:YxiS n=3 Tax=Salimicrobium TaxID=351195 RepID=K2GE77_9BACI|nr:MULTISPECIES: hypothetical protein [Salimicrobium]AKG05099.1 hypothetical protein AAV35_010080 [Salimicrobium jeotgali]EKE32537.1 hypothetical protein MJ3_03852 [Salimicrobium jeotgali]MBM7695480.1 hypothetical protein [Salimicrobium jeotgali]SDY15863.1 hypothetical protein SAMN04488081_2249 [Salimicrobium album]SIS78205.1 hypothetical protein SAMN05421758_105232 [Salimicrobium salexigens]